MSTVLPAKRPHPAHRYKKARRPAAAQPPQSAPFSTSNPLPAALKSQQSGTAFSTIQGLSPDLLRAIPYEFCTEVQAATLPVILQSHDVLAQAKTGTGKTMGFLIPAIQHLLHKPYPSLSHTSIFILSPTRELALQIAVEAKGLLERLGPAAGKYGVQTVVGGTNVNTDIRNLQKQRADILIATPGRAIDLLKNGHLKPRLAQLSTLVLDEADRLLDQGFRRDITTILEHLPNRQSVPRQTLLFSATIPEGVHQIASLALNPGHKFISTISEGDTNVHEHVKQELVVVPQHDILPATLAALNREVKKGPSAKTIVFLPTARAAGLFHEIFANLDIPYPVWAIHSRLSQSRRTKVTEEFRQAPRGVLFSSDVMARGLDIPGITAVLQVGAPMNEEQYIHRLGRTARAGAEGHGVLILGDFEQFFLRKKIISDMNLEKINPAASPEELVRFRQSIDSAIDRVQPEIKAQAYAAWLGYYKGFLKSMQWDSTRLVAHANAYSEDVLRYGNTPPGLLAKTVGMMGLRGVQGLNVVKSLDQNSGGAHRTNSRSASKPKPRARPN